MKINEIVNEADFWQGMKQAGAGLKGLATGLTQAGTSAAKGISQAWQQGAGTAIGGSVAAQPTAAKPKEVLKVVNQAGQTVQYTKIDGVWHDPQGGEVADKTAITALDTRLQAQKQQDYEQRKAAAKNWVAPSTQAAAKPAQPAQAPAQPTQTAAPVQTPAAPTQPPQPAAPAQEPAQAYEIPKGQRMVVQMSQGTYYKLPNGNWYNEFGQILTNRQGIQNLENRVDSGGGKMEPIRTAKPAAQQPQGKRRR